MTVSERAEIRKLHSQCVCWRLGRLTFHADGGQRPRRRCNCTVMSTGTGAVDNFTQAEEEGGFGGEG